MIKKCNFGLAVSISWGIFIGLLLGFPISRSGNSVGYFLVITGSLFGGLFYRLLAKDFPIDSTARKSRHLNAVLVTFLFPILTAVLTGMDNGEEIFITKLALLLGISVAIGILVSGDRRPPKQIDGM